MASFHDPMCDASAMDCSEDEDCDRVPPVVPAARDEWYDYDDGDAYEDDQEMLREREAAQPDQSYLEEGNDDEIERVVGSSNDDRGRGGGPSRPSMSSSPPADRHAQMFGGSDKCVSSGGLGPQMSVEVFDRLNANREAHERGEPLPYTLPPAKVPDADDDSVEAIRLDSHAELLELELELVYDTRATNPGMASDRLTQRMVAQRWPKYREAFRGNDDSVHYLKDANILRQSLGQFLYALREQRSAPRLTASDLFPRQGRAATSRSAELRRRRVMLNTTRGTVDNLLRSIQTYEPSVNPALVANVTTAIQQYTTQATAALSEAPNAPSIPTDVVAPLFDAHGGLLYNGDAGPSFPRPTTATRQPEPETTPQNSGMRVVTPADIDDTGMIDDEILGSDDEDGGGGGATTIVGQDAERALRVVPRYSQELGACVQAALSSWPPPKLPIVTLGLLESGALVPGVPLAVEFGTSHVMFGAASYLVVDSVVALMRSAAAANYTGGTGFAGASEACCTPVSHLDLLGTGSVDAFLAVAGLDPFLSDADAAEALEGLAKKPDVEQLDAIKDDALWQLAGMLKSWVGQHERRIATTPTLQVTFAYLSPEGSGKLTLRDGIVFEYGTSSVSVQTGDQSVRFVATTGCQLGLSSFRLRLWSAEGGAWYTVSSGPSTEHHVHVRLESQSPAGGSTAPPPPPTLRTWPPATTVAREALYTPSTWSVARIDAAKKATERARESHRIVDQSCFLAGNASLFDVLTVYALFAMGSSDTSGDDDPTLPTQRTLTELTLIRLCYRRTDEIVIVLPDPDASKKTPVVYSCNAHTRAWDAYKEGDSYKDHENKRRPYGGDPSGIGQDVRECVMAVRALVGSGRFYDAAIGAVQLAMCRLNAKSASYRATADAVLARLRRVFTSHDERVGVNMDLPTADNACERRKVLADEAREVITSLEKSFGDIATFHTTLRAILGQLNLVANSTMPRLGYGDSFLMFSPSGYFCCGDRQVYHWRENALVCIPLCAAHRFDASGIARVSPHHAWVFDSANVERVRALLASDYHRCIAAGGTDVEAAIAGYAGALAVADRLAEHHPDPKRAKRVFRSLLRMFGYEGGKWTRGPCRYPLSPLLLY